MRKVDPKTIGDYKKLGHLLTDSKLGDELSLDEARLAWLELPVDQRATIIQDHQKAIHFLTGREYPLGAEEYYYLLDHLAQEIGGGGLDLVSLQKLWMERDSDTKAQLEPQYRMIVEVLEGRKAAPYARSATEATRAA